MICSNTAKKTQKGYWSAAIAFCLVSFTVEILLQIQWNKIKQRKRRRIGHVTVVFLVTWQWMQARVEATLLWFRPSSLLFSRKCQLVSIGTTWFAVQSSEVCIKTRPTPATLPFKGQATKLKTVKCSHVALNGSLMIIGYDDIEETQVNLCRLLTFRLLTADI